MADIPEWPTRLEPAEMEFWPWWNTRVFESPFTRASQVLEYPGCIWKAQMTFRNLNRYWLRDIEVFILQLRGGASRVRLGDLVFSDPAGPAMGNARINGASQSGSLLNINGCQPEQTFLATGDYFTTGNELKRLTADAVADIGGNAVLHFLPPLRKSPAHQQAITVRNSWCLMRLDDDDQLRSKRRPVTGSLTLSFTEAVF